MQCDFSLKYKSRGGQVLRHGQKPNQHDDCESTWKPFNTCEQKYYHAILPPWLGSRHWCSTLIRKSKYFCQFCIFKVRVGTKYLQTSTLIWASFHIIATFVQKCQMLGWHNQDKMQFHWYKTPCNFIKWAFQHSSRWARNWQGGENNVTTKEPAVAFTKSSYCHTSVLIIKFSMCAILPTNKPGRLACYGNVKLTSATKGSEHQSNHVTVY